MLKAFVEFNSKLNYNIYLLGLKISREVLEKFLPGQFLKIKINKRLDPLIPRPFTVHAIEKDILIIMYQVVGKGTKALTKIQKGEEIEFLGPLGNPFPDINKDYIICAGGIGIAGFGYFLQKRVKENKKLPKKILYGAKTAEDLVRLSFFKTFGIPLELSTEDGTKGYKGYITDILEKEFKNEPCTVLACGSLPMMKKVTEIGEKYQVDVYLVMTSFLACGTGFCKGCVIPLRNKKYAYLCKDGVTFLAKEIDLESLC
ncbi:hypothetical protein DRN73_03665 [Candidatus Pacearchaeota archaeon]|nr:MAG: hypothetical protein DRN73_03665 [Candidatus Pacearchaeota archaeon]